MKPCRAKGCETRVPSSYLMCPRHWRMVPPEVRSVWNQALRDHEESPDSRSLYENFIEVVRIVAEIEARLEAKAPEATS